MNVHVSTIAQPVERTLDISEKKIQQNAENVDTGDTIGTYSTQDQVYNYVCRKKTYFYL